MKKFFAAIVTILILSTAVVIAAPPKFDTPYIGNSYRKTFHKRDCPSVLQMNHKNQVPFNSVDEALNAGYFPVRKLQTVGAAEEVLT